VNYIEPPTEPDYVNRPAELDHDDLPPEKCECDGQGLCRECRIWAAEHGYHEWGS